MSLAFSGETGKMGFELLSSVVLVLYVFAGRISQLGSSI